MKRVLSITLKTLLGHLCLCAILVFGYFTAIDVVVERFIAHKVRQEVLGWLTDFSSYQSTGALINSIKYKAQLSAYRIQIFDGNDELLSDTTADQNIEYSEVRHDLNIPTTRVSVPIEHQNLTIAVLFNYKNVALNCGDLKKIYVGVGALFSLIFVIVSVAMLALLSKPFQDLFRAINAYACGKIKTLPTLYDKGQSEAAVFARTLNGLNIELQTQANELKWERQRTSSILDSLEEGVITIDPKQIVTYVNMRGAKLLQIAKAKMLNQPFSKIAEQSNARIIPKCKDLIKASLHNHSIMTDALVADEEGQSHIDIVAVPMGLDQGIALIFQDHATNQKIVSMGKEFIANASHELRTPITIIKGFAEMLHDLPEISSSMLEDIMEKIVRNCHRMSALVKNLLVLADLDNLPRASLEERNLIVILENCKHQLSTLHPECKIEIHEPGDEITVSIDGALMELAIMNLLENAVKYSPSPAKIDVNVEVKGAQVVIVVSDCGIGIPQKELDHIFDRFYTVNKAHSRKLGGAGLGLSIVRTIVEKHDGRLDVTSVVGEGTQFTVILPLVRAPVLV